MGFLVTNFGADAGCTDDGKQWVSFWPHCHINTWEDLWEFVLVLICWSNRVYKHLQTSKIKECWNKILKHFSCFECAEMDRSTLKQLTMPILTDCLRVELFIPVHLKKKVFKCYFYIDLLWHIYKIWSINLCRYNQKTLLMMPQAHNLVTLNVCKCQNDFFTYLFELYSTIQSILNQTDCCVMWEGIQVVFCPNKSGHFLLWKDILHKNSEWNIA